MSPAEMEQTGRDAQRHSPAMPQLEHGHASIRSFRHVPVEVTVEVGRGTLKIRDLVSLRYHSIFELDRNAGSKLDVYVNGVFIAKGEPVVVNDQVGIKIDEILESENQNNF
jgi:flagellar motor switch protein FliN